MGFYPEEQLDLAGCRAVTVSAVLRAAQANPNLKSISISGGQLWSLDDVRGVLAACPGLKARKTTNMFS